MYKAPVAEIAFTLRHVAGLDQAIEIGSVGDLSADLADAILEEAARFTDNDIVPLAAIGDTEGARLVDGVVVLPKAGRNSIATGRPADGTA